MKDSHISMDSFICVPYLLADDLNELLLNSEREPPIVRIWWKIFLSFVLLNTGNRHINVRRSKKVLWFFLLCFALCCVSHVSFLTAFYSFMVFLFVCLFLSMEFYSTN